MDLYTLHFDGSCGPKNPGGTAAYGFTINRGVERIASDYGVIGTGPLMSNNVAEYCALARGLQSLYNMLLEGRTTKRFLVTVRGDSQLVIKQMSGIWRVRDGLYQPYWFQADHFAAELRRRGVTLTYEWVPRESNQECDDLSKAHLART